MSGSTSRSTGSARAFGVHAMLLVTTAVWGVNLSAVKALTASLDILVVAAVRMVVAVLTLTVLMWSQRQARPALTLRQTGGLALCALLMVYGNQILFASALAQTSATSAAIVMALSPLVSSLVAAVLLREAVGWQRLLGIAIGFGGVAAVILNRQGASLAGHWTGDLLMLASVVCFAIGGALVQRMSSGLTVVQISWAVHVVGTTALVAHAFVASDAVVVPLLQTSAGSWALILFSGIGATALSAIAWNRAISRIGVARTALAFYWVPVFGLLFAVVALGEPLSWWHGVGLAGVVVGSVIAGAAKRAGQRRSGLGPGESVG